ncbi:hypothetical protein IFT47_08635 [Pseudomonas sp. CFBP 13711]|uniref:hypothetical protein n=1 Tax=unclassified Pseudomonas TaxID=196821 RepID=UPI00178719D4|nr:MULTISPECIES: hypothetical protein [unclassified Pseudomonas]MBD8706699.1 hypothetical protein [Pseudomonas sp. CFBP 13711]MBD8712387.1 hypothetical protein [Pseudomonas sp. CFBP 13715]
MKLKKMGRGGGQWLGTQHEINGEAADKRTIKVYIQRTAHQDGSFEGRQQVM